MQLPSKDEMKARFWDLHQKMDAIRARIAPLREARDAYVNEAREKDEAMMADIRAIEAEVEPGLDMYAAQNELAMLARILVNVGDRPEG